MSHIAARATIKVSWDAMLYLARRWDSSALIQRLGYFLDLHQADIPDNVKTALLALVRPKSKILLASRRKWGTTGKLVRTWNVVENVPHDVLMPKEEKLRRRVDFSRKADR